MPAPAPQISHHAPPSPTRGANSALPFTALLLLAVACAPAEPPKPPTPAVDGTADALPCDPPRQRPDGGCCPIGAFHDIATAACTPVGPPECAASLFNNPAACEPRWCWHWRNGDGQPCAAEALDCLPAGRRCSAAELAAGGGCPAGTVPSGEAGASACLAAGLLSTSPWYAADGAAPPPLPALPASASPRWCLAAGLAKACAPARAGGWAGQQLAADGTCAPAGLPWTCPPGFVIDNSATAGASGLAPCVPDPAACGPGPWPQNLPASGVLYVDAKAAVGGDGSAAKPMGSLVAAVAAAQSGQTVALAAGTYPGALELGKGLHIRGRCAALSHIDGGGALAMVRLLGGAAVKLTDVRVTGEGIGVLATAAAQAVLERVMIEGVRTAGVAAIASGAAVTLRDSLVVGTRPSVGGDNGRGVEASAGGHMTLQRVRISRQRDVGLLVTGVSSQISAEGVLVDDTRANLASVVAANHTAGIFMGFGEGHVAGSVIRDTGWAGLPRTTGEYPSMGDGVIITESKAMVLSESLITGNQRAGVFLQLTQSPALSALAIRANLFGVVADEAAYTTDRPLAIIDNLQANVASDLGLALPTAPAPAEH